MFEEYRAKPFHSAGFLALAVIFGSIGSWKGVFWFHLAALICLGGAVAVILWIFWEYDIRRYDAMGFFSEKLSKLDDERIKIFGMNFPKARLHWSKNMKPIMGFDWCEKATIDHLAVFLNGSDSRQVFPVRYWSGEKRFRDRMVKLEIEAYDEILDNFIENKLVVEDSAAGSHSWLWNGTTTYFNLKKFWREWIEEERQIPNLNME